MLLRHSYWGYTALFPENTLIFGAPQLKKGPHRRFGGLNLLPILYFKSMATKDVSHFSGLSPTFLFIKWGGSFKIFLIRLKLDFDLISSEKVFHVFLGTKRYLHTSGISKALLCTKKFQAWIRLVIFNQKNSHVWIPLVISLQTINGQNAH